MPTTFDRAVLLVGISLESVLRESPDSTRRLYLLVPQVSKDQYLWDRRQHEVRYREGLGVAGQRNPIGFVYR